MLFLLKERSDGRRSYLAVIWKYVCMYVRNKRRRQYHQIVTKFLFKKNEKKSRIKLQLLTWTDLVGRPKAADRTRQKLQQTRVLSLSRS